MMSSFDAEESVWTPVCVVPEADGLLELAWGRRELNMWRRTEGTVGFDVERGSVLCVCDGLRLLILVAGGCPTEVGY